MPWFQREGHNQSGATPEQKKAMNAANRRTGEANKRRETGGKATRGDGNGKSR